MAVDFSGRWLCTDVEGDTNALMTKMGASWIIRTLAASLAYAKGRQVQEITHSGDTLTIKNSGMGPKSTEFTMIVGGGEQDTLTMSGQKNRANPVWEGSTLVVPSLLFQSHVEKRSLDNGIMVLEQYMGDVFERRRFTKQ